MDSGATDHMTCDPHKFINFSPNCSKIAIINANGISSPIEVEGVGTISISPSLSIFDVLFVPTLNCNLLSVSKLTKSHSCVALFYPTHYFSRTSIPRRRLTVVEREGLYYLENVSQQTHKGMLACLANEHIHDKNKKEIWLWHRRLGDTSLGYLEKIISITIS